MAQGKQRVGSSPSHPSPFTRSAHLPSSLPLSLSFHDAHFKGARTAPGQTKALGLSPSLHPSPPCSSHSMASRIRPSPSPANMKGRPSAEVMTKKLVPVEAIDDLKEHVVLGELLGSGSSGSVYRATHLPSKETVVRAAYPRAFPLFYYVVVGSHSLPFSLPPPRHLPFPPPPLHLVLFSALLLTPLPLPPLSPSLCFPSASAPPASNPCLSKKDIMAHRRG